MYVAAHVAHESSAVSVFCSHAPDPLQLLDGGAPLPELPLQVPDQGVLLGRLGPVKVIVVLVMALDGNFGVDGVVSYIQGKPETQCSVDYL